MELPKWSAKEALSVGELLPNAVMTGLVSVIHVVGFRPVRGYPPGRPAMTEIALPYPSTAFAMSSIGRTLCRPSAS